MKVGFIMQMKKVIIFASTAMILIAATIITIRYKMPIYRLSSTAPYEKFYGSETIDELKTSGTQKDRDAVTPVLEQAENAFSAIVPTNEVRTERFGKLARYAWSLEDYPEIVSEKHKLKLYTAHCEGNTGYVWICYSQMAYNDTGKALSGSYDILSRWEIHKDVHGKWHVTQIREAP